MKDANVSVEGMATYTLIRISNLASSCQNIVVDDLLVLMEPAGGLRERVVPARDRQWAVKKPFVCRSTGHFYAVTVVPDGGFGAHIAYLRKWALQAKV